MSFYNQPQLLQSWNFILYTIHYMYVANPHISHSVMVDSAVLRLGAINRWKCLIENGSLLAMSTRWLKDVCFILLHCELF